MANIFSTWTQNVSLWTERVVSSHRLQLFVTAVISGSVVAGTIFSYQSLLNEERIRKLKETIPHSSDEHIKVSSDFGIAPQGSSLNNARHTHFLPDPLHEGEVKHYADSTAGPASKEDERSAMLAMRARRGDYDEDLILEQLARNRVFLTDAGLEKLRSAFIIIVGCGGVGSHATAALARSGVSKLRLIDFDQVTLSSLNRHAVATLADVGSPKVQCIRKRLEQVTPWTRFDCRNELFTRAVAEEQLASWDGHEPTFVVDAIDNIESKVELLHYCHSNSIPVISSMGAGCKSDPTRVFLGDISSSTEDPLSRSTRRRLRLLGVTTGIPVVFSTEKTAPDKAQLLPLPEDEFAKGGVGELGVLPDFRVRILPVLGTMPAMFGLCVANHIMLEITGYPHEYLQSKARMKMYDSILTTLQGAEERLARWATGKQIQGLRIPVTIEDVGYLIEEVYRGKSVISGLPTRLVLSRWHRRNAKLDYVNESTPGQKFSELELNNIVCMTKEEAALHEKEVLKGEKSLEDMYGLSTMNLVKKRQEEEAFYDRFR